MLSSIQLSEDVLSEFIVALEVSRLVLANQLVHLGIHLDIMLHQLASKVVEIRGSLDVALNHFSHLLLICVFGLLQLPRASFLASMKLLIVRIDWRVVARLALSHILVIVKSLYQIIICRTQQADNRCIPLPPKHSLQFHFSPFSHSS